VDEFEPRLHPEDRNRPHPEEQDNQGEPGGTRDAQGSEHVVPTEQRAHRERDRDNRQCEQHRQREQPQGSVSKEGPDPEAEREIE
jgi:hypothetical protein